MEDEANNKWEKIEHDSHTNVDLNLKDIQLELSKNKKENNLDSKGKPDAQDITKKDLVIKSIKLQGITKENSEQILARAKKELGFNFVDSYFINDVLYLEILPLAFEHLDIIQLIQTISQPFSFSYEFIPQSVLEIRQSSLI